MRKKTWMKKLGALLMSGTMIVTALAGCGQGSEQNVQSVQSSAANTEKSSENAGSEAVSESENALITTDPVTISVLLTRQTTDAGDPEELWYFDYLEYWLAEQGYDVTFELQQVYGSDEVEQQLSLKLGTGQLPDLVWGINLTEGRAVTYGAEEGMVLDWTPYINETYMPNLTALLEKNEGAVVASTCPLDNGIYGLPFLAERGWGHGNGNFPGWMHLYINTKWLETCDLEVPQTFDQLLDALRAFKENITLDNGQKVIPMITTADYLQKFIWGCLGYYAGENWSNGLQLMIKNEEIYLPAATEDYRTYIETMNTLYSEGLVDKDFLTTDNPTKQGQMSLGMCGVLGDAGLATTQPETWADWTALGSMTLGDSDTCVAYVNNPWQFGRIWASADTKYPELLAYILDYVYSEEGSTYYYYGPMKGTDPLGKLDGWYYNDLGVVTCDEVEAGKFASYEQYAQKNIYPTLYTGNGTQYPYYSKKLAGLDVTRRVEEWNDKITGETYEVVWLMDYTKENADGYMRWNTVEAWKDNITTVRLPGVYLSAEDSERAGELNLILTDYINAESAKFITGTRPLDEIEKFQEELKGLGVEEYLEIYRNAYGSYLDAIFK